MAKTQEKPAYNPFAELAEIRDQKGEHLATRAPGLLGSQVSRHLGGAKSQNPSFIKLTAYVPRELHRAVKVRLVEQGREISGLVEELVAEWLKRQ
jgi:hypothetical protein